jgi:hypothetical protein
MMLSHFDELRPGPQERAAQRSMPSMRSVRGGFIFRSADMACGHPSATRGKMKKKYLHILMNLDLATAPKARRAARMLVAADTRSRDPEVT